MSEHGPGRGKMLCKCEARAYLGKRQEPKEEKADKKKQIKGDFSVSMLKRFSVRL